MVKVDEYDKEEEERRLFYVAMSRAKKSLYLSYSGNKPTYFISEEMKKIVSKIEIRKKNKDEIKINIQESDDLLKRLKDWRKGISKSLNIPSYVIMHDKTIADIIDKKPEDLENLKEIYGMGQKKIIKYGEEILNIINFNKNNIK